MQSEQNLCREFYYECVSQLLRPRVIVDYEREPWIMDEGTVRITFDKDVRAAVGGYDIFDKTLPALPVLEPGKLIMEVKFTEFLRYPAQSAAAGLSEYTAVSKYVLCCDKTAYQHGFGYWQETGASPTIPHCNKRCNMSTKDFIKKSVLENFTSTAPPKLWVALLAALLMGVVIYLVYRRFYTGVVFSRSLRSRWWGCPF